VYLYRPVFNVNNSRSEITPPSTPTADIWGLRDP
jgi:hypothetical protein